MTKRVGTWLALTLILGLVAGCGEGAKGKHTIGAPTKTVEQMKEWPEGLGPAGGGFRPVDMPAKARKNVVEASPEAVGSQNYFETLGRQ